MIHKNALIFQEVRDNLNIAWHTGYIHLSSEIKALFAVAPFLNQVNHVLSIGVIWQFEKGLESQRNRKEHSGKRCLC